MPGPGVSARGAVVLFLLPMALAGGPLVAQELTLTRLVTPQTILERDGRVVTFAIHGFLEFSSLADLFAGIDAQAGRWRFPSDAARQAFAEDLLARGIESRVVSMTDERPLETLVTHTAEDLRRVLPASGDVFRGAHWRLSAAVYEREFLRVQAKWKTSLNCWSASPSIAARVLSNWYWIEEGIVLHGASYDTTEHFWQAVKFHPDTTLGQLINLLDVVASVRWAPWVEAIANDQDLYLAHTYRIEFLRRMLDAGKVASLRRELDKLRPHSAMPARALQQRSSVVRFTGAQSKSLWGDLADMLHLLRFFGQAAPAAADAARLQPVLEALERNRFDAVYLEGRTMVFGGPEFQRLMLDIWKVKFLTMPRFKEVILSTRGVRLDHFLNDGGSSSIPIPTYVEYLNQIRALAEGK